MLIAQMNLVQKHWWRRPSRAIPAVLLAFVAIAFVGIKLASRSGLNRELEKIRAKGWPTNPKELDAWYAAVPAEENAGLKFLEAGGALVEPSNGGNPGDLNWRDIPNGE